MQNETRCMPFYRRRIARRSLWIKVEMSSDSPSRVAFVSCEGNATLVVVDLNTKRVIASDRVGNIPDVLAFDPGLRRLYVAAESGVVAAFQMSGSTLQKIGQTYLA